MPINELIARGSAPIQFESPVNRLAKVLQLQGAQQNIARGEMEQDQYRQGVERKNKLIQLMGGLPADATDEQRSATLKGGGYFEEADKLDKGALERQKIGSEVKAKDIEIARKKLDIAGSAFNQVRQSPTLENANAVLDYLGANGVYTPELVAQYKAQVAANPAEIGRLADIAFRSALDAKEQLVKHVSQNMGGTMVDKVFDPTSGQLTQIGSAPITQSADNAATLAVTRRGQDMVDTRSKEATSASLSKPFEVTAPDGSKVLVQQDKAGNIKPVVGYSPKSTSANVTEGERKAATLLQRMQSSETQLEEALKEDKSAAKPGVVSSALRGAGAETLANTITPESRQKVEAAQLDILDAALTLGTGAAYTKEQLEGYRKSYFPQLGDKPSTIKDKQARLNNILEAARIAAGRAAGQVTSQPPPSSANAATSPIADAIAAEIARRKGNK